MVNAPYNIKSLIAEMHSEIQKNAMAEKIYGYYERVKLAYLCKRYLEEFRYLKDPNIVMIVTIVQATVNGPRINTGKDL